MITTEAIIQLVVSIVFGAIGALVSRALPNPGSRMTWIVWIIGILLCANILPGLFGPMLGRFGIFMGASLHGLGLGILFGFILRTDQAYRKG